MAEGFRGNKDYVDIIVIPIGDPASRLAIELAAALSEVFFCRTEPGQGVRFPFGAWNPGRGQYLPSSILDSLQRSKPADATLLLGVTDCDLYLPQLNFVFGEADMTRGIAVISIARLREEFCGHPPRRLISRDLPPLHFRRDLQGEFRP